MVDEALESLGIDDESLVHLDWRYAGARKNAFSSTNCGYWSFDLPGLLCSVFGYGVGLRVATVPVRCVL